MSLPANGYDEHLLASAPAATRAEKQEGYNVDLLEEGRGDERTSSLLGHAPTPSYAHDNRLSRDTETVQDSPTSSEKPPALYAPRSKPWWRTPSGVTAMIVMAMVVIGAVVGGAVGGVLAGRSGSNALAASGSAFTTTTANPVVSARQSGTDAITRVSTGGPAAFTSQGAPASASSWWNTATANTKFQSISTTSTWLAVGSTSWPETGTSWPGTGTSWPGTGTGAWTGTGGGTGTGTTAGEGTDGGVPPTPMPTPATTPARIVAFTSV